MRRLAELGRLASSTLDMQEVREFVVRATAELMRCDLVRLWHLDEAAGELVLGAQATASGLAPPTGAPLRLPLDLDRFKEVNDTFGHQTGDELLQEVAERLRQGLRAADTLARLGGDEFAVVLAGSDAAGAAIAARKLVATVREPFNVRGHRLEVGLSIGIARYPDDGSDAETLLRRADIAMYTAKRAGSGVALVSEGERPG